MREEAPPTYDARERRVEPPVYDGEDRRRYRRAEPDRDGWVPVPNMAWESDRRSAPPGRSRDWRAWNDDGRTTSVCTPEIAAEGRCRAELR
jgi:hypothetical protein